MAEEDDESGFVGWKGQVWMHGCFGTDLRSGRYYLFGGRCLGGF